MRAQPVQMYVVTLTAAGQGNDKELITEYSNMDAKNDLDREAVHKNMSVKGLREMRAEKLETVNIYYPLEAICFKEEQGCQAIAGGSHEVRRNERKSGTFVC